MNEDKKEKIIVKGVEIPDLLQDQTRYVQELYAKWWLLGKKIIEHPKRFRIVSDPFNEEDTITLDLRQAWPTIRKNIQHLNKKEQTSIRKDWNSLQALKARKGAAKRAWEREGKNVSAKDVFSKRWADLVSLFGKYKTIDEVLEIIKEWGYIIDRKQVHQFFLANKKRIGLLREEWAASYEDFSLAKKRGRIEKLAYLVKTQMDRYQTTGYRVEHSREIRALLESIKKEIEGERIVLDINGNIDPALTLEANKTLQQVLQRVSLTSLVISIVAAKRNVNPLQITTQLQKSIYAKFSGAIKGQGNFSIYQSKPNRVTKEYDWIAIEKLHADDAQFEEIKTEVPKELEANIKNKREVILEILNKQKNSHIKNKKELSK